MPNEDQIPEENSTEDTVTGQQVDTDTDTEETQDTDTDNTSVEDDRLARLEQRLEDTQVYIQKMQQEKADLDRRREQPPAPETNDPEQFYRDPYGELQRHRAQWIEDARAEARKIAAQTIDEAEAERFVRSTADMKKYAARIRQLAQEYPDIANLPSKSQAVRALFEIAKGRERDKPSVTQPADTDKKSRAETAGGGSGGKGTRRGEVDIEKMSFEDIEKAIGYDDSK